MLIMPNNNTYAHLLSAVFPGQWGMLMSPSGKLNPKSLPYALDNDMYQAWVKVGFGIDLPLEVFLENWSGKAFQEFLVWAKQWHLPLFVVVPDVPGNAKATIRRFKVWRAAVERHGFTPAIAVQDGMTPDDVPDGVVCFVGGSTEWKWKNVERFAGECEVTHVGRVNSGERMWQCHRLGVQSVDGSGIFRGDQKQLKLILRFCHRVQDGLPEHDQPQMTLFSGCSRQRHPEWSEEQHRQYEKLELERAERQSS